MHIVKFEVVSYDKDEEVSATLIIETKRGETWVREESRDVVGGTADAKGAITLQRNQRLVIEARQEEQPMFDKAQFATVDQKKQQAEGGADVAQPLDPQKPGQNIKQSDERMAGIRKASEVQGATAGFAPRAAPPNADANKMDKTYSDKKPGESDPGTMTGGSPPSGMRSTGGRENPATPPNYPPPPSAKPDAKK